MQKIVGSNPTCCSRASSSIGRTLLSYGRSCGFDSHLSHCQFWSVRCDWCARSPRKRDAVKGRVRVLYAPLSQWSMYGHAGAAACLLSELPSGKLFDSVLLRYLLEKYHAQICKSLSFHYRAGGAGNERKNMARTRAFRRHQEERAKRKTIWFMTYVWWGGTSDLESLLEPKIIGRWTSVHRKPCSCWMCCNWRKTQGPTRQELVHKLSMIEQITEEIVIDVDT